MRFFNLWDEFADMQVMFGASFFVSTLAPQEKLTLYVQPINTEEPLSFYSGLFRDAKPPQQAQLCFLSLVRYKLVWDFNLHVLMYGASTDPLYTTVARAECGRQR
jgi:hypothetical protein